jgi:hypothetical protein
MGAMELQTFIFIGRSGCGKGTQVALLQEYMKKQVSFRVRQIGGGSHGSPSCSIGLSHAPLRTNYVEQGIHQYELKFQLQRIKWLKKEAKSLNLQLVPA